MPLSQQPDVPAADERGTAGLRVLSRSTGKTAGIPGAGNSSRNSKVQAAGCPGLRPKTGNGGQTYGFEERDAPGLRPKAGNGGIK